MKRNFVLLLAATAAGLGACASRPANGPATQQAPSGDGSILLGSLTDARLPAGECGMVLWTLDQARPSPVFRYLSGKSAEVVVNGKPLALARVETLGGGAFGVFERQAFVAEDGLTLKVEVHFSVGFDGGTYLERGLITAESPAGWRTVAPSAGLAGCRAR